MMIIYVPEYWKIYDRLFARIELRFMCAPLMFSLFGLLFVGSSSLVPSGEKTKKKSHNFFKASFCWYFKCTQSDMFMWCYIGCSRCSILYHRTHGMFGLFLDLAWLGSTQTKLPKPIQRDKMRSTFCKIHVLAICLGFDFVLPAF